MNPPAAARVVKTARIREIGCFRALHPARTANRNGATVQGKSSPKMGELRVPGVPISVMKIPGPNPPASAAKRMITKLGGSACGFSGGIGADI